MEVVYTYKSNWWGYVSKRVLITVIAFFIISYLMFSILYCVTPVSYPVGGISPTEWDKFAEEHITSGTPQIVQYFHWMGDFFTGNWGNSLYFNPPYGHYSQ